jgi:hypothetical protein
MPAYMLIKMFGTEEIVNITPPTLANMASLIIYGVGLIFKVRVTAIVKGIRIITDVILFKIAPNKTAKELNTKNKKRGLPLVF